MYISRRLTLALCALTCTTAFAQAYPDKSRPIRLIVPFGAGSGTDVIARAYGRAITDQTGSAVVVENRPGAEAVIGVEAAKNAAPDGYTLVIGNTSTHVLNVHTLPKLPYDPVADFQPVAGVADFALVINAGPSSRFQSVRELVEHARANPGKLNYGSASATTRMAVEMLEQLAGVKMTSVPYKAMAQATTALASGEIDLLVNDVATAAPYYQSNRIRPLGSTGRKRLASLPNVPTVREQGLAEYEVSGWFAWFVPAQTPAPVAGEVRRLLRGAAKSKYVADAIAANSYEPLEATPAELSTLLRGDIDRWGKLFATLRK